MRIMAQHECRGKWKIGEETGSTLFLRGYEYRYWPPDYFANFWLYRFAFFAACQDIQE